MRKPKNFDKIEKCLKDNWSDGGIDYEPISFIYLGREKVDFDIGFAFLVISKDKQTNELVYWLDRVKEEKDGLLVEYIYDHDECFRLTASQIKALGKVDLSTIELLYK